MKHNNVVTIICIVCVILLATPYVIYAHTASDVHYTVKFSQIDLHFKKFDGYDVIRMKDAGVMSELGRPVLPVRHLKIAIPTCTRAIRVEARSLDSREIPDYFFVIPGQPPLPVGQRDARVFVKPDPAVYESNTLYPGVLATLDHQGNLAGQQIVSITVCPVHYIPVQKKLRLHTNIELIVHCTPDDASKNVFLEQYYRFTERQHRSYEDMLKTMVVNPEDVCVNPLRSGPSPLVPSGQYDHVIITSSALESYFEALIYWHMKKGLRDTVVTTDWIYANYAGPDDTLKIRQFIIDANSDWGTMYFLMGGEGSSVPYGERHYYGSYPDQIAPGDQYYSDFDDDWVHEVYVGRVSADGETQINTFIDKVLKYEKDPPLTDYPAEVLLIGMDLDDDTPAEQLKDSIATFVPGNFTIHKVYDSHGGSHKDSVKYYLNAGNNLVNHMDHSNKTVMGTGYHHHDSLINRTDVDNLTNDNQMSIVTSGGCEPGAFDYDDCIGEHFIIYNSLQAGVAFIGNSRHGWYYGGDPYSLSGELDLWFWHGVFTQGKDDIGKALVYAKHQFPHTAYDWEKACEWNVNLLGEPAMLIWTDVPAIMAVTHDTVVPNKPSDFTVMVMEDDETTPVGDALVCCWIPSHDPPIHVTGYTDASGTAIFSMSPTNPGDTVYVTVTKQNYIPYEGYAIIVDSAPPSAPYITQAEKSGNNVKLTWNTVNTDTLGNPETMDYYVVYRNTSPSFIPGASDSIGVKFHPDTTYIDSGALTAGESYYYLVKAVDETGHKSKESNMGYVLDRFVNYNTDRSSRNWVSLPWQSGYSNVSDLVADLSPNGDPLESVTNLRDDMVEETWLWDTDFMIWYGPNDFSITPGCAYEMVPIKDTALVLVGSNDPDGLISLNYNTDRSSRNWVSIPFNADYSTVDDIAQEYSPAGDPLESITNLRDDMVQETWLYDTDFMMWYGPNDFAIEPGRGYEFVPIKDTTWNPNEYSNEAFSQLLARRGVKRSDVEVYEGQSLEPDRAPVWIVKESDKRIDYSDAKNYMLNTRRLGEKADYREPGISHIVRVHLSMKEFDNLVFTAYRPEQPYDVLTENMIGSCVAIKGDRAAFFFNVANFKLPWQDGEEVIVIIEALRQGRSYFTVPSVILDKGVDVQDVDNVTLTPISKPVIAKDLISWHGNDNDNVVGYSLYEKDKRLNEKVLKQNYYSAKGDPIVKPVIRGGYETVYGSQGSQNRLEAHLPMSFTFDIYPNPFVAQIRINYAVPKQTLVEMVIYDVSGRQVKTLVNDTNKPGYYDIIWDGSDNKGRTIPSGIYFIRFAADPIGESDAFRAQDKILLVK